MANGLSRDEVDALREIAVLRKGQKPSACVSRNVKRLSGLKLASFGRDGRLSLTPKGEETLFLQRALDGLRAAQAGTAPDPDVAAFLARKGHIEEDGAGGWRITARGAESLADIASHPPEQTPQR